MNKVSIAVSSALAVLMTGFSMGALADSEDKAAETAAQQKAAITLVKAIDIAEQATGGKSSEAEFDLKDGKAIYEVEVTLADGSEVEVNIDAESGAVLSQKADDGKDDDHDDDEDEDHKEDGKEQAKE